jgi:glycosyltransferase involved in cell wall biosynthesis
VHADIFSDFDVQQKDKYRDGITVLYMNHVSVSKGILVLLKSISQIIKRTENIKFIIAGDIIDKERNIFFYENGKRIIFENIRTAINNILLDEKIAQRLKFTGMITDTKIKQDIFKSSDIFVLPSYSEGCPMSVLEAMAAGLPLVVTPVGALIDIMVDGKNGFFVRFGDSDDLANKITTLANDSILRKMMGEENKSLVRSKLNVEIIASQLFDVFQQL